jgi:hypothetical protein
VIHNARIRTYDKEKIVLPELHRSLSSQQDRNVQPPIMYFAGLDIHEMKSSIEDVSQVVSVHVRITES